MGSQYAGDENNFPDDYTIPDDSDPPTAAIINVATEALGDRTAWLKKRFDATVSLATTADLVAIPAPPDNMLRFVRKLGGYVFDASSTLDPRSPWVFAPADATPGRWIRLGLSIRQGDWRAMPPHGFMATPGFAARAKAAAFVGDSRYWDPGGGGLNKALVEFVNGAARFADVDTINGVSIGLAWCINDYLWNGATLQLVEAIVQGGGGHAALPAAPMSIGVFRVPTMTGGGGLASLTSAGDFVSSPAASAAAYDAQHTIYLTPNQHHVIDKKIYSYYLQCWNEWGFQALSGAKLYGANLYQANVYDFEVGGVV